MSKFSGKCKGCGGRIRQGEPIIWSPDLGARHDRTGCDKINGKSRQDLAAEWDDEHRGELTALERFEQMRENSREYGDIREDDLWIMARQDARQNPYR